MPERWDCGIHKDWERQRERGGGSFPSVNGVKKGENGVINVNPNKAKRQHILPAGTLEGTWSMKGPCLTHLNY